MTATSVWSGYSGLRETLQMMMGTQLRLSDLHTSVVIPSYQLETSSPFTFWHKHSSIASERDTGYIAMQRSEERQVTNNTLSLSGAVRLVTGRDFKVWEVACASAAAPTFFPSKSPHPPPPATPKLACYRAWPLHFTHRCSPPHPAQIPALGDCVHELGSSNPIASRTPLWFPLMSARPLKLNPM